jgi:hypothetical protein
VKNTGVEKHLHELYAVVLLLCFLPGTVLAAAENMSVYEVSQKWMLVETELLNYVSAGKTPEAGRPLAENLLAALDDFSESVEEFLQSPLYESGRLTPFSQRDTTLQIRALLEELERAIRAEQTGGDADGINGKADADGILEFSGEIRTELGRWLYTIYPQKLALTSPRSGGRSVGIVLSRTKATEFSF